MTRAALSVIAATVVWALPVSAHIAPKNPYHWHITCTDFLKHAQALAADPNFTRAQKYHLLRYLATKLEKPCRGVIAES